METYDENITRKRIMVLTCDEVQIQKGQNGCILQKDLLEKNQQQNIRQMFIDIECGQEGYSRALFVGHMNAKKGWHMSVSTTTFSMNRH